MIHGPDLNRYAYEIALPKGTVVHINGVPYAYLGSGRFGTNTTPTKEVLGEQAETRVRK